MNYAVGIIWSIYETYYFEKWLNENRLKIWKWETPGNLKCISETAKLSGFPDKL